MHWWVTVIGFIAQILFSSRLIIQWFLSEKEKKVVSPLIFWQLSLLGGFLLFIYGWFRDDFSIMLGQILTYYIYIRNLQLLGYWKKLHFLFKLFILSFPVIVIVYSYNNNIYDVNRLFRNDEIPFNLLLLGIVGQVIFTLRFVVQWILSERSKKSELPIHFWILSLIGSLLIFTYAIIREDYVLMFGHIFGLTIYIRNIILYKKQHERTST